MAIKFLNSVNADSGVLYVDAANNRVGIGTASPETLLQVNGAVYSMIGMYSDHTYSSNRNWRIVTNSFGAGNWGGLAIKTSDTAGGTPNTTRFGIDYLGNVGIGTTSPGTKLHVYDATANALGIFESGDNLATIRLSDNDTNGYWHTQNSGTQLGVDSSYSANNLTVRSGGNVGIGTTSPDARLEVNTASTSDVAINANERLKILGNGTMSWGASNDYGQLSWDTGYALYRGQSGKGIKLQVNSSSTVMTLTTGGNVGIGTTSPNPHSWGQRALTVQAPGTNAYSAFEAYGTGTGAGAVLFGADSIMHSSIQSSNGSHLIFTTNSTNSGISQTERMRITSAGNIGIGTTSPTSQLTLSDPTSPTLEFNRQGSTANGWIKTTDNSSNVEAAIQMYGNEMRFYTNGVSNQRMVIDSSGNVGIGTTSPSKKLHVSGDAQFDAGGGGQTILVGRANGQPSIKAQTDNGGYLILDSTSNFLSLNHYVSHNVAIVNGGGNVGIGTTSPTQKLHVVGASIIADSNTTIDPDTNPNAVVAGAINDGSGWGVSSGIGGRAAGAGDTWAIGHNGNSLYMAIGDGTAANSLSTFLRADTDGTIALEGYGAGYLKTDASGNITVDSDTIEDTLDSVTDRGATTTNNITVGDLTASGDITTNAGIFYSGNSTKLDLNQYNSGYLRLLTDNTERVRVTATGNVGIGTTSPASKLHVNGDVTIGSIGTTAPQEPLMVKTKTAAYFPGIKLEDYDSELGLYIQNIDGYNTGIGTGRYYNSGFWRSDLTTPTSIRFDQGLIRFYAQSGVTADTDYSPSERMRITSAGNVGIGTTSPSQKLHVAGTGRFTGNLYSTSTDVDGIKTRFLSGAANNSTNNGTLYLQYGKSNPVSIGETGSSDLYVAGDVGIGTTNPGSSLQIEAPGGGQQMFRVTNHTSAAGTFTNNYAAEIRSAYTTGATGGALLVHTQEADNARPTMAVSDQNGVFTTFVNGKVGIGTTSPSHKLHIESGVLKIQGTSSVDGTAIFVAAAAKGTQQSHIHYGSDGDWYIRSASTSGKIVIQDNGGNVGIGTSSPSEKLHVSGNIKSNHVYAETYRSSRTDGDVYIQAASSSDFVSIGTEGGNNNLLTVLGSGNVGVGTASPSEKLHVYHATTNILGYLQSGDADAILAMADSGGSVRIQNTSGNLRFLTGGTASTSGSNTSEVMRITSSNVGIGTASPSEKLHVSGNVRIEGDLTVNGSYTQIDTDVNTTEQWNVTNDGTGPAVTINQTGSQDIMDVQDDGTSVFYIEDGGNVGIGTTSIDSRVHIEGTTDGTGTGADAILHVKQNGGWNANQPWALYVEGYSYLNGFRINANDGIRALHKVAAGGQLGFSVTDTAPITFTQSNSTERMRVHTNGYIGIGTSTPDRQLQVHESTSGTSTAKFTNSTTGEDGDTGFFVGINGSEEPILYGYNDTDMRIATNGTERLRITSAGNVGIGTTSPGQKLVVAGGTNGRVRIKVDEGTNNYGKFEFSTSDSSTGSGEMLAEITATITDSDPNSLKADLSFSTNSGDSLATAMTIRADRFVRIGNTAASNAYTPAQGYVAGLSSPVTGGQTYLSITTGGGSLGDTGVIFGIDSGGGSWYHREDKPLRLYTQSIERMRVTGSGNVGIGNTNPQYKLDVAGAAEFQDYIRITNSGGSQKILLGNQDSAGVNNPSVIVAANGNTYIGGGNSWSSGGGTLDYTATFTDDGNVGIGTTSPLSPLTVQGNTGASAARFIGRSSDNVSSLDFYNSGQTSAVYIQGNGSWIRSRSDGGFHFAKGATPSTADTNAFTVEGLNVGIGTTSPDHKLTVYTDATSGVELVGQDGGNQNSDSSKIIFNGHAQDNGPFIQAINTSAYGIKRLGFFANRTATDYTTLPTESMSITHTGNVGIGTTSPENKLSVAGDIGLTGNIVNYDRNDTTYPIIHINDASTASDINGDVIVSGYYPIIFKTDLGHQRARISRQGDFQFYTGTGGSVGMHWDNSDARLGIGTTGPKAQLHLNDGGTYNNTDANNRLFIERDDHAYILVSTPDDKDQGIHFRNTTDNANVGRIAYQHRSTGDSLRFRVGSSSNNNEFLILNSDGTIQIQGYGAGYLKTDANGNISVDTSTIEDTLDSVTDRGNTTTNDIEVGDITTKNDSGIYSFSDTVNADSSEDIFSISNQHGSQAFRVTFVCSTSAYSVAKTFEVVHSYGNAPIFFKVVDTGAYGTHDFDVSFTNDATDDSKVVCSITNNSTTVNANIVSTVFLGGSPTAITVTAL